MMSLCIEIKFSRPFKIKYPEVVILLERKREKYREELNKNISNNDGKRKESFIYMIFMIM